MNQKLILSLQRGNALAEEIEKQLNNATVKSYEILTQSQAKLADLDAATRELEQERATVQATINRNRDNARRLIALIERDERIEQDLSTQIAANLASIHSLREAGVQAQARPQKDEEDGQSDQSGG